MTHAWLEEAPGLVTPVSSSWDLFGLGKGQLDAYVTAGDTTGMRIVPNRTDIPGAVAEGQREVTSRATTMAGWPCEVFNSRGVTQGLLLGNQTAAEELHTRLFPDFGITARITLKSPQVSPMHVCA